MLCCNMITEGKDLVFSKVTWDGMLPYFHKYRVINNFLTHVMKLVNLNGGKDCNVRHIDGKRKSGTLEFPPPCLISAPRVYPL